MCDSLLASQLREKFPRVNHVQLRKILKKSFTLLSLIVPHSY